MDIDSIKTDLEVKGYAIIPGVLSAEEVEDIKVEFEKWQKASGAKTEIHGIIKHYQVGNTRHAWKIRTNPRVQKAFASIWETSVDNLIVSQDGTNWMTADCKKQRSDLDSHRSGSSCEREILCARFCSFD